MKKLKKGLTLAALGLGMCVGFGAAFVPGTAEAVPDAARLCDQAMCDRYCGEGFGRCNPAGWCECW